MKLRDANRQVYKQKTHSHILVRVFFAFIFPEYGTITSSEEALEMCEGARFLSGNKAKSSVNLPVQLRFILVNFIQMAFDVLLT